MDRIPLEPETRNGLSLARNDALATIARSVFLACPFVSTLESFLEPVRSGTLRSVRFRAETGRIHHPEPVARELNQRSCDAIPPPLPFGSFRPSGSKRSTGFTAQNSPDLTSGYSPLLSRSSFDLGFSCLKLPFVLSGYRSRGDVDLIRLGQ
jgi:hypothetical protein